MNKGEFIFIYFLQRWKACFSVLPFISYTLFCFLFFGIFSGTAAYSQSPAFYRYDASSGLSCNEVYDVLQDKKGFIWAATDHGLFRYDGYSFQPFTTAQGLTDNTVFRIEEDFRGRIWAMPFNGELCYIENDRVVAYAYNDTLAHHLPGMRIARSLCVLPSGAVRIGYLIHGIVEVSEKGIFKNLDPDSGICTRGYYTAIDPGTTGLLYGIRSGKCSGAMLAFSFYNKKVAATAFFSDSSNTHQQINGIRRRSHSWCFVMKNKLFEISAAGEIKIVTFPCQPLCVYEDAESCLWVGMQNGIRRYSAGAAAYGNDQYETFFPSEAVSRIIQDREGSFWMATLQHGLFYMPSVYIRSWSIDEENNDKVLKVIPGAQKCVYALWQAHGLFEIKKDTFAMQNIPFIPGNLFKSVIYDTLSDELMISSGYTARIKASDKSVIQQWRMGTNNVIRAQGKTYAATSWILYYLDDKKSWIKLGDSAVHRRPDVLFADHNGKLWIGGIDGVYNVRDTSIISCAGLHPLFSRRIAAICELDDSTLVIATQSNGIAWMKNGNIEVLSSKDGIPTDHVLGITRGRSNTLWITTTVGLYSAARMGKGFHTQHFSILDGLLNGDGHCYFTDKDGKLWLSASNHVILFDPQHVDGKFCLPPVYLRSVMFNDSALSLTGDIELLHNQNSLRITFAGLAYRLQGHARYRYRINGKEEEWKYTLMNTVELAELEAGHYRFEVEVENENGRWSNLPAVYTFTILPPYWETWWFRGIIFSIAAGIIAAFILFRFHQVQRQNKLREQAQEFRQEALASQMNPHFIFNSLNTIQTYVLREDKIKALEMFSAFASFLRKSLDQARERYITLAEEAEMLKLYFEIEKLRFEERLSYEITAQNDIQASKLLLPSMLVQPLVENAIRHGIMNRASGGKVEVRFYLKNNGLLCEVEDDGVGRETAALHKHNKHRSAGSTITEDRLRVLSEMNGSSFYFEITDKYDADGNASGTLVRFSIPSIFKKTNTYETITGAAY
jgi:ligand-binding sensor domain-containing protein/anti-sigma regulatory factor (Ser/Thr protein kinase)